MAEAEWIAQTVQEAVPGADVHPTDLTGGGDHWYVAVVSDRFEGALPLARQKPILKAFQPHIESGAVHALDLKCLTPEELEERHGGQVPAPFVPHSRGEGAHPGAWD